LEEEIMTAAKKIFGFPQPELETLPKIPGLVGDVAQMILRGSIRPNPPHALGTSLALGGTIIGRVVAGPTESATHLYCNTLAPSGWGKDDPLTWAARILECMGRDELIGPDELVSSQGFWRYLAEHPRCLMLIDEFGDQLALIQGQRGNEFVAMLFGTLKKCWNAFKDVRTAWRAHSDGVVIRWAAPSIVGVSTPEAFFRALQMKDVESGFYNRFLNLPAMSYRKPPEQKRKISFEPPRELIEALLRLPQEPKSELDKLMQQTMDGKLPEPKRIGWGPGAEEPYVELSRQMDEIAMDGNDVQRDQAQRVCEILTRVATIIAVLDFRGKVSLDDTIIAGSLATRSFDVSVAGIEKYMTRYVEFPRHCAEFVNLLGSAPNGVMSAADLRLATRGMQRFGNEWERVTNQLLGEGTIVSVSDVREAGSFGRPSPGYKLVKREG
jgi:hypothetical protein